jgi:hypothetical protein
MDPNSFVVVTPLLTRVPSRRDVLRGLAGVGIGLGAARLPESADAKKNKKRRKKRKNNDAGPRCARNGERCDRRGDDCQASYCLKAPFTIEAIWESGASHGTYLYVPPEDEATGPFPYTHYDCNQGNSACEVRYPLACVSEDDQGPGNAVATIYKLLPGGYEYWIDLDTPAAAGELVIVLRDGAGRVVREWPNPTNATNQGVAWHVFDFDADGHVRSVDVALTGFYVESTDVCPYMTLGRRDRVLASTRARRNQR